MTQGVLLSGGLDSSLVASIAKRAVDARGGSGTNATGNVLHSFCIGLKGSPDIDAAQRVADFLGTKHHSFQFTIDEALDSISDAIYHMYVRWPQEGRGPIIIPRHPPILEWLCFRAPFYLVRSCCGWLLTSHVRWSICLAGKPTMSPRSEPARRCFYWRARSRRWASRW